MKGARLLASLLVVSRLHASETLFSVNDDVLAYPQFEVVFSDSYVADSVARVKLSKAGSFADRAPPSEHAGSEVSSLHTLHGEFPDGDRPNDSESLPVEYLRMILKDRPYLCSIPQVEPPSSNVTKEPMSEADEEKELVRASDRGWELLQGMEGKPCLFYSTGWWSYSFCYNSQIKQFHALPPGTNGAPIYPPTEDPTTPSYVLGKYEPKSSDQIEKSEHKSRNEFELQTKAETRYLVQKLGGGTACDLTGKGRKVEVQFHCNPQVNDRIGWIKETATCSYMMVVYTPRLCNDVAFLPPRDVKAHAITCQEILGPDEVEEWEASKSGRKMIGEVPEERLMVGDIEVGAMKEVGGDNKRIEKGKIVSTPEERAETVVAQKNGKIAALSPADLKKRNINPEAVESFRMELQKRAGSKDWKIEIWDEHNGQMELRGIIAADSDAEEESKTEAEAQDDGDGSEETYKEII